MINILNIIKEKARQSLRTVCLTEGEDERVLSAAFEICSEKLAKIVLIGDKKIIIKKAKKLDLVIDNIDIIDIKKDLLLKKKLRENLFELRKHKGLTRKRAQELINDENYFACMLLYHGYVDAIVGSCTSPTARLMRPALQIIKTKPGISLVNELCIIIDKINDRVIFTTDSSLNINPTPKQLAQITLNSVSFVQSLGIMPRVALLSFSTKESSGNHYQIESTKKALNLIKRQMPSLIVDGEMQVDAAINIDAAKRKCPDSPIKGNANILIYPNLTTANITTHALGQFCNNLEFLFVVLGLNKPVVILGRSHTKEMIKNMILIGAMQTEMSKNVN